MNRFFLFCMIFSVLTVIVTTSYATHDPNVIHACMKKNNGQLRVVSGPSQCNPSETPIELQNAGAIEALSAQVEALSAILTPKTVFVTSAPFNGDLDGLAGADAKCQAAAEAAGLPGTYMAWLSDSDETPITRFNTLSPVPYINTIGQRVAANFADLCDGALYNLFKTETGGALGDAFNTWTGTNSDCSANTDTCMDWESSSLSDSGGHGDPENTDSTWTELAVSIPCQATNHLYCIEQ